MMLVLLFTLTGAGIEVCNAFSTASHHQREPALVPRITLGEYLSSSPKPYPFLPVLIRDITSPEVIESIADELMQTFGGEEVQMQRKIKDDGGSATTEIYDVTLEETVDYMMDSSHYDSYFAFCEGILESLQSNELSDKLKAIREAPFGYQEDWFDYFPPKIKPTDAVILAGAGATSTFHRDPFEWTGTSICLEGTKIWRFVLPPSDSNGGVSVVDDALGSYRLDSIAWEEEGDADTPPDQPVVLSAGWQSDLSLYDTIDDASFPSAFEWVQMEEENEEKYQREMEDAGMSISRLLPSDDALHALGHIKEAKGKSHENSSLFATAIQQPGDLLLIPAHCWHQTYSPLPSIAVASQRCGATVDGANVVNHILEMARQNADDEEAPSTLKCDKYDEGMGKEVVGRLVGFLNKLNTCGQKRC